jgi:hypothetical protein
MGSRRFSRLFLNNFQKAHPRSIDGQPRRKDNVSCSFLQNDIRWPCHLTAEISSQSLFCLFTINKTKKKRCTWNSSYSSLLTMDLLMDLWIFKSLDIWYDSGLQSTNWLSQILNTKNRFENKIISRQKDQVGSEISATQVERWYWGKGFCWICLFN